MSAVWARLLPWIELVRLPALFSAWSNIVAAHLIATAGSPRTGLLLLQLGICTCLYWAGMILNDCFDLAEDRRDRPERPLPSGRVAPAAAWGAGIGLLLLGLVLGAAAGPGLLLLAGLLALTVLAYDGWLKHTAAGPLSMGLCRYLNWLLGLGVSVILLPELLLALPVLLYTTAVTTLSRAETRDGDSAAALHSGLWIGAAVVAALALFLIGVLSDPIAPVLLALGAGLLIRRLAAIGRDARAARVRAGVRFMLLGMIPLDALLLAGDGQWPAAAGLLMLLVPGRGLARWIRLT